MELHTWRKMLWAQALGDQYCKHTDEVYQHWLHLRYHYLKMTPEITLLINKLHQHYLVGLITNGPSTSQWEKIERLNLKSLFDIILVSGDLPWEKPHKKIFHEACTYLGVEPSQCIMVGDKLETDILGGLKADLGGTVWVPLNPTVANETIYPIPDYVISSVTDLIDLLPCRANKGGQGGLNCRKGRFSQVLQKSLPELDDCNSNSSDGS